MQSSQPKTHSRIGRVAALGALFTAIAMLFGFGGASAATAPQGALTGPHSEVATASAAPQGQWIWPYSASDSTAPTTTLAGQWIWPYSAPTTTLAGQWIWPYSAPTTTLAGQWIWPYSAPTTTLAGQWIWPYSAPTTTLAGQWIWPYSAPTRPRRWLGSGSGRIRLRPRPWPDEPHGPGQCLTGLGGNQGRQIAWLSGCPGSHAIALTNAYRWQPHSFAACFLFAALTGGASAHTIVLNTPAGHGRPHRQSRASADGRESNQESRETPPCRSR